MLLARGLRPLLSGHSASMALEAPAAQQTVWSEAANAAMFMSGSRGREFGSRGKGSRRMPWRDGGRRKQRCSEWRKQAMHAVDDPATLEEPVAALTFRGYLCDKPEHLIYRLDQEMARAGIPYHPEYGGRWRGYTIAVTARHKEKVREIMKRLLEKDC
jgi:hypothetical protein